MASSRQQYFRGFLAVTAIWVIVFAVFALVQPSSTIVLAVSLTVGFISLVSLLIGLKRPSLRRYAIGGLSVFALALIPVLIVFATVLLTGDLM
jgi:phosphatidylserine synthase